MPVHPVSAEARRARIEQMIAQYEFAARQRVIRRAMRLWRLAEAERTRQRLEAPEERVH